jgi:hypothetical protein
LWLPESQSGRQFEPSDELSDRHSECRPALANLGANAGASGSRNVPSPRRCRREFRERFLGEEIDGIAVDYEVQVLAAFSARCNPVQEVGQQLTPGWRAKSGNRAGRQGGDRK